jgi:hypothetical protein
LCLFVSFFAQEFLEFGGKVIARWQVSFVASVSFFF